MIAGMILRIFKHYTSLSILFLAVFLLNIGVIHSFSLGLILLMFFLIMSGTQLGRIVAPQEEGPLRWALGSLLYLSVVLLILTAAYYTAFIPKELVIVLILLTTPTLTILHKRINGAHWFERFHSVWKEHAHSLARPLLLSVGLILLLQIYLLSAYQRLSITDAVRSVWERLDPTVILAMGLSLLLLFGLFMHAHARALSLVCTSLSLFGFLSLALFVFPLGYGFDSFIHQATERHIAEFGSITPKPLYYIGQYALVLFFHHGFLIPVEIADRFLAPVLTAVLLPAAWYTAAVHITSKKRLAMMTLTGLFLIPLSSFVVTTPQALANLWTLLFILLSVPYVFRSERPGLFSLGLIAAGSLAIHPIAGLPAALYFALLCTDPSRAPEKWKQMCRFASVSTFLIATVVLPMSFLLNGWLQKQTLTIHWSALNPLRLLSQLNLSLFFENRFHPLIDFVYLYGRNAFVLILIVSIVAWWLYRKDLHERTRLFLLMTVALAVNYLIMNTAIDFTFLIDYERQNYAERLIPLIAFFLTPFFILGLSHMLLNLYARPIILRFSILLLLCAFSLSAFYLTYPRRDVYETHRGFNVSQDDLSAVRQVESWAQGEPYLTLANQSVSAAAISEIGFRYYGSLFFYPIPTGEALYQQFLLMNSNPTRETAQAAVNLVPMHGDVDLLFFLVNHYWWDAPRIIETAKTTADDWQAIGDIHLFRYDL